MNPHRKEWKQNLLSAFIKLGSLLIQEQSEENVQKIFSVLAGKLQANNLPERLQQCLPESTFVETKTGQELGWVVDTTTAPEWVASVVCQDKLVLTYAYTCSQLKYSILLAPSEMLSPAFSPMNTMQWASMPSDTSGVESSGVAKGRPGQACARPKHHVRTAHVMQSCAKRGLAYSRCPANTNDLATPLVESLNKCSIDHSRRSKTLEACLEFTYRQDKKTTLEHLYVYTVGFHCHSNARQLNLAGSKNLNRTKPDLKGFLVPKQMKMTLDWKVRLLLTATWTAFVLILVCLHSSKDLWFHCTYSSSQLYIGSYKGFWKMPEEESREWGWQFCWGEGK